MCKRLGALLEGSIIWCSVHCCVEKLECRFAVHQNPAREMNFGGQLREVLHSSNHGRVPQYGTLSSVGELRQYLNNAHYTFPPHVCSPFALPCDCRWRLPGEIQMLYHTSLKAAMIDQ